MKTSVAAWYVKGVCVFCEQKSDLIVVYDGGCVGSRCMKKRHEKAKANKISK